MGRGSRTRAATAYAGGIAQLRMTAATHRRGAKRVFAEDQHVDHP